MPDLVLGVIEVAYENEGVTPPTPKMTKKGRVHRGTAKRLARQYQTGQVTPDGPNTTVSVAQALQDRYHLFDVFYEQNENDIAGAVIHSLEGALEDLYAGAPAHDPFAEAGGEIEQGFRQWLLIGAIEELGIEGVPTKASIERKSSRFKGGIGPSERPSFVDTGTLELSLKAWIE